MTSANILQYRKSMFVSIVCDCGSESSVHDIAALMSQYGFEKVQRACWESSVVTPEILSKLKREIDRVTDYYDVVRLYQYPLENNFYITILKQKKWRRIMVKSPLKR